MGMTQGELAFRAGTSAQFMNDLLMDRRRPSPSVAKTIFLTLNLTPEAQNFCVERWTAPTMAGWKELMRGDK